MIQVMEVSGAEGGFSGALGLKTRNREVKWRWTRPLFRKRVLKSKVP